jgi:murein DD-endopeptidase MepM/ murein hydrolase activator NlpD
LAHDHPTASPNQTLNLKSLALKAGAVGLVVIGSFYLPGRHVPNTAMQESVPAPAVAVAPLPSAPIDSAKPVDVAAAKDADDDDADVETQTAEADDAELEATPVAAERVVRVRRGDTFAGLLMAVGVPQAEAREAMSALKRVFDPKDIKPGQAITLTLGGNRDSGGEATLIQAAFAPRIDRALNLLRNDDGSFKAEQHDRQLIREFMRASGSVRSSLFEAGATAGVPNAIMVELIRAFSYDVDFQRDIWVGDRFEVVYERYRDDQGRATREGNLMYGALTLGGQTKRLYRYKSPDGTVDFYNEQGESVRKALLRTPIDGAKLTSGFGGRMHPILGYTAMHRGVDFGASAGTPIQAAGDGVVEMAGWNGSFGNYVRIRHNSEYSTAYAHMSRVAKLQPGQQVRQGQVIGYVGSTGRSTGPHLHYEVLRRGTQVNPLGIRFPTGRRLEGTELAVYRKFKTEVDTRTVNLPMAQLVKAGQ